MPIVPGTIVDKNMKPRCISSVKSEQIIGELLSVLMAIKIDVFLHAWNDWNLGPPCQEGGWDDVSFFWA